MAGGLNVLATRVGLPGPTQGPHPYQLCPRGAVGPPGWLACADVASLRRCFSGRDRAVLMAGSDVSVSVEMSLERDRGRRRMV
jgi:hypothetical protein